MVWAVIRLLLPFASAEKGVLLGLAFRDARACLFWEHIYMIPPLRKRWIYCWRIRLQVVCVV